MINIVDKTNCCGCWACENACPKKCITMTEDCEGFLYPKVELDNCINCKLCEKVCPIINRKPEKKTQQKAFLLQHKDEQILQESASGGAFTAIASYVISKGGVVFGAAYDTDFQVVHKYVKRVEELKAFRNSKYVQSYMGNVYQEAKDFLLQGRMVCFSGTPCQLEGLYSFLRKQYENLITVDVMCHSVTSPKIFKMYIQHQKINLKGNFDYVLFRDKRPYGYKYSSMSIYCNEKQIYKEGVETDVYLRSFFTNINVRPSCTKCHFKKQYHLTDFTIWDCFDVYRFNKELDNDKGVTRVLANTEKAFTILKAIEHDAKIVEILLEDAILGVDEMLTSVKPNSRRESFFKDSLNLPHKQLFQKYFPNSSRVYFEKYIRLALCKLGIYSQLKRFAKLFVKDLKRS